MAMNQSDFQNKSANGTQSDFSSLKSLVVAMETVMGIDVCVGGVLNIWLLAVVLTSKELRATVRNKLLCNLAVADLTDLVIYSIFLIIGPLWKSDLPCYLLSALAIMVFTCDFVGNWTIVAIVAFYLADVLDFNPTRTMTRLSVNLAIAGVILLPWLAGIILVPSVMNHYYQAVNRSRYFSCMLPVFESLTTFKSVDTAVPLIIAVILVTLACVFFRRRFSCGFSSGLMKAELIGQGRQVDNPLAYLVGVILTILCEICIVLDCFGYGISGMWNRIVFYFVATIISDTKPLFMPLPWLLLPDLRQRVKTWRPWRRGMAANDLTVAYNRDTN